MSKTNRGLRIVILSRAARGENEPAWGLGQDSKILEQVLREIHAGGHTRIESVDHIDPTTFVGSSRTPHSVDVQIHLEVPCRAAWPWAKYNIVVVNQEWWPLHGWDWVCAPIEKGGANMFVFKSQYARRLFPEIEDDRCRIVSWRASSQIHTKSASPIREFLYLVGASVNKLNAAKQICKVWKSSWPALIIVGNEPVLLQLQTYAPDAVHNGVVFHASVESNISRIEMQTNYAYHIVASGAEGFGYTFAEAASVGALPVWTDIPVYNELWGDTVGTVGKIKYNASASGSALVQKYRDNHPYTEWSESDIVCAVESVLSLDKETEVKLRERLRHTYTFRISEFRNNWRLLMKSIKLSNAVVNLPPPFLKPIDLPRIAVITITRNRPQWFGNMARNILLSDYPLDKVTWVVADDGDYVTGGRIDEAIAKFQSRNPHVGVKYLSLPKVLSVGAKRNRACQEAPSEASIFMMMDDDDHYPSKSMALRVAWLQATRASCVYCSTLPMYDCRNYISAVNVPPLDLSPAERISEATLCFTREFWNERKFPATATIAEGDGFCAGREAQTVEIPSDGIIVSFLHAGNTSSRRIPAVSEPNGCHYGFPDDYFSYISQAGVMGATVS